MYGPRALDAVPALIRVLSEDSDAIAQDAADALIQITEQDFGQDPARWQEWWEER
jgi:hypothetical protein